VAIAAPRGHAKSTAITFAYVLAELMFRTAHHVLVLSSNESIAAEFVNDIKIELQENEMLDELFGPFTFLRESTTEIVVRFGDGVKFRVVCKGAGQRMRGLKWERKRPDLVVGDDMEDDELVLNEERRIKFRKWFYGAVRPITKAGGRIRIVGTVCHMDSLLERWMPQLKSRHTVQTKLKDYSTKLAKGGWKSVKYRAHEEEKLMDDDCQVLWPEQYPVEILREIREDYARQGMLDTYGQEYLNNPIDQSTAFFKREDFIPMDDIDRKTRKNYYVGVDLAISEKKRTAYSVFVIGGQDEFGYTHIVDVRRGRWDAMQIIDEIFDIFDTWGPNREHPERSLFFRFEKENIARTIKAVFDMEMIRRGKFPSYDMENATKDKMSRNRAFQARMRAHQVRFDTKAEWYPDYHEELAHFPKWPSLDQADASGWLGMLIADMIDAPTDQDIEDRYYQQIETDHGYDGRDAFTGY
jgi:predicted phage terminase large subunit-like protein